MRLLLVDDSAADLELLCAAFHKLRIDVACADTDEAAYTLIRNRSDWDALVVDLNLGYGTTGFDVARAARGRMPELPVVYISRYDIASAEHAVSDSVVMPKPLRMPELAETVVAYLGERAARDDRESDAQMSMSAERDGDMHA